MKKFWMVMGSVATLVGLTSCASLFQSQNSQQMTMNNPRPLNSQMQPPNSQVATTLDRSGRDVPLNSPYANQYPAYQDNGTQPPADDATNGRPLTAASMGSMNGIDRNKLFHALDAPPGKPTSWTNMATGVSYTVTPIKKVAVGNNRLCRLYSTVAERNGQRQEYSGTACISDDGNWHTVN